MNGNSRNHCKYNNGLSGTNNINIMQQATAGVAKLRPKNKLISNNNNNRSSSHQMSEKLRQQQHQQTTSNNTNMQQSDFKVANELAKCYEEIDQIYDYIRGLAPLPPELRKIKWIDFEQQEKLERAAKQLAAENNLKAQQQQLQSHRHQQQHQPQHVHQKQQHSNDIPTSNGRLVPLKVTGGSVTPQVKRVESLNMNHDPTTSTSRSDRQQQQQIVDQIESIKLPRAQSDKNIQDKSRFLARLAAPSHYKQQRPELQNPIEPAIRMIDSRPASASDDIMIPQRQDNAKNIIQDTTGRASLHSSTETTSSSSASSSSNGTSSQTESSSSSKSEKSNSECQCSNLVEEKEEEVKQKLHVIQVEIMVLEIY